MTSVPSFSSCLFPVASKSCPKPSMAGYEEAAAENQVTIASTKLDTNAYPIEDLLPRARELGADLIVGPLEKENVVEAYYLANDLNTPLLALNSLPAAQGRNNVYSLSIDIERNTQFGMDTAWNEQCRWMLLLIGDTPLSNRIATEVRKGWEDRGGLLTKSAILHNQASLSRQISDFMEVDAEEIAATKEVYRRYLRALARQGRTGEGINEGRMKPLPSFTERRHEDLLLGEEEIAWIHQPYYEDAFRLEEVNAIVEEGKGEEDDGELGQLGEFGDKGEDYSGYTRQEVLDIFRKEMEESFQRVEADCLFLAMEGAMAAQVRPFLSFYLSNDLEVYGTFLLFDRQLNSRAYEDLQGVAYGEMPWLSDFVRSPAARAATESTLDLRYRALGKDAFLVGESFARMNAAPKERPLILLGNSGLLHLQEAGEIVIQPRVVVFNRGIPLPPHRRSIFP